MSNHSRFTPAQIAERVALAERFLGHPLDRSAIDRLSADLPSGRGRARRSTKKPAAAVPSYPRQHRGHSYDPTHLYMHDSGIVFCGAHVGIEATYYPNQWSDLGPCREFRYEESTFRCEDGTCA